MASFKKTLITYEFLCSDPNAYFIYGSNLLKKGNGDVACKTKTHPHSLGFITKKFPGDDDGAFYKPDEYELVFFEELMKLARIIEKYPTKTFYISRIGGGAANRFMIWEKLISIHLVQVLSKYDNVVFCWKPN